jgi:hypothetical protein
MKKFFLGVLFMIMIFTVNHSSAQRYARGNVHINQGGYRADLHVWGRTPCNNYYGGYYTNNYYRGYYGNTLSGFGYLTQPYYQRALVPVTICQDVITGQGYDQWGNLVNYVSRQCWTEYR